MTDETVVRLLLGCISSNNTVHTHDLVKWIEGLSKSSTHPETKKMDDMRLVRMGLRMLGSLVQQSHGESDAFLLERILNACTVVLADPSLYGMDVCMEGLNVYCIVMSMDPVRLSPLHDGRDVGLCVAHVLTGEEDEGICVKGYLRALAAHPAATLRTLRDLLKESKVTKERGKACLMACLDHAYRCIVEHEPDVGIPDQGMTTVMEHALTRLGGLHAGDCQNIIQEIMLLVPLDAGEGARIHDAMIRVGCMDTVPTVIKDVEEGELFVRAPDDARMMIEGIVPVRVSKTLKVGDLPETVNCDAVRDACDAFTGIQSVERYMSHVYITCTSMPGVARCYEAMYTRGAQFWGSVGFDGVPQVDLCSVDSSSCLFMQGVKDVEHEEAITRVLEEEGITAPSSLIPLHVGMAGVILCFDTIEDADGAFRCLGGVEGKRERDDDVPREEHERKKARKEENIWTGRLLRNKQLQCTVHARPLKEMALDWPQDIEVNQRVDVQYVCGTLLSSVPKDCVHLFVVYPEGNEESEKGLVGFDAYLRGKKRAGVALLTPLHGMNKRTLYLIPVSDQVCYTLGVDSRELPSLAVIGMVVDQ